MSQVIRVSSDVYSRLGKHAKGFDTPANVIEKLLNYYEGITQDPSITQKSKDTTKYFFKNDEYGKGRLVLAIIEDYVSNHPDISFSDLLEKFPKNLQGSIGVFNKLEFVKDKYEDKNHKRHYLKSNEIIQIADCSIVVCTQWGLNNIEDFINQAKSLNYKITPN